MSVTGRYIVVFKKEATDEDIKKYANEVNQSGGSVGNQFDGTTLKGFSAEIPQSLLLQLQSLQNGPIDYIEPDQVVHTQ